MVVRGEASFNVEVEVDDLNWKQVVVVQRKAWKWTLFVSTGSEYCGARLGVIQCGSGN